MNRQQVKELLPIIQAFADGKQIEIKTKEGNRWCTLEENDLQYLDSKKCDFRIKPEPKYRPFKNVEECWQEMLKHQPFGWVKTKTTPSELHNISNIFTADKCPISLGVDIDGSEVSEYTLSLLGMFDDYKFIDGTPFGIKEE